MNGIQTSATTVDEAATRAAARLGMLRDRLRIGVLEEMHGQHGRTRVRVGIEVPAVGAPVSAAGGAETGCEPTACIRLAQARVLLVEHIGGEPFVLPDVHGEFEVPGPALVWLLPGMADAAHSLLVRAAHGCVVRSNAQEAVASGRGLKVERHTPYPECDVLGHAYTLQIPQGDVLAAALAAFYWGTLLPCVVERTAALAFPEADGYVLSSPVTDRFAGTYPSCDHEFQIKGRIAFGNELDLAVVRRMIGLALRVMRANPDGAWGCPCAVQPDGEREYYWRRSTADGTESAQMFRLSGNAEVLEAAWLYYAATKDRRWLGSCIADLERATQQIERFTDASGWLASGAFYEDAVIKDGCSTESAALAARALHLLAELETVLDRDVAAQRFRALSARIAARLGTAFPAGLWDAQHERFLDWVDAHGRPHDHLQLLGNILPPLLGYATHEQSAAVARLVRAEQSEYQRFPTFVAARIRDYTPNEIGIHGPFDSCAMARTWCWDAAYWHACGSGQLLLDQLLKVARRGRDAGWRMAERYDMGHVYYADGTDWHGSPYYYEYPCVFAWVLVHEYLGLRPALDADLEIAPRIVGDGEIRLTAPQFAVACRFAGDQMTITNLAPIRRSFRLESLAQPTTLEPNATWSGCRPQIKQQS